MTVSSINQQGEAGNGVIDVAQALQRAIDRLALVLSEYYTGKDGYSIPERWVDFSDDSRAKEFCQIQEQIAFVLSSAKYEFDTVLEQISANKATSKTIDWDFVQIHGQLAIAGSGFDFIEGVTDFTESFSKMSLPELRGFGVVLGDIRDQLCSAVEILSLSGEEAA